MRDLLAIARALYRSEAAALPEPDMSRLARIQEIGHMLRQALELSRTEPDTMGHRAAWGWAEKGTAALGELVASTDARLAPVVSAAAERLRTG